MKALKKLTVSIAAVGTLATVVLGSYNSMVSNNVSFMSANSGIKFSKRLDEINGKVTIGRMAASATPWKSLEIKQNINEVQKKITKKVFKKTVAKVAQKTTLPSPTIGADLDLQLSNVFHKKPLKAGTFSGTAKTVDGIIEEIYVSLPNGKTIEINTRDRMVGNVFQYEDTTTREMKSGMFYEVKKGTYMITLTNDSEFAGTRMEFKAENSEVAYNDDHYNAQESWEMDQQSQNNELAQENTNDQNQNNDYQDVDYAQNDNGNSSYGFNFKS